MIRKWIFLIILLTVNLCACTKEVINYGACSPIRYCSKIAVVPFSNHTETPLAGERAMSITAALLESRGICNLAVYQNRFSGKILFPGMNKIVSQPALLTWSRRHHARYMLTGSVNEWTYKVGLDGEPVVGVSIEIIDLRSGCIVWSAVGSKSDGCRIAVTTVAQSLLNKMLDGLLCTCCYA